MNKELFIKILAATFFVGTTQGHPETNHANLRHRGIASADPDRIFLTFCGDATTSRAVTWRTGGSPDAPAYAEIAKASDNASFAETAIRIDAKSETIDLNLSKSNEQGTVHYHSAIFEDLGGGDTLCLSWR